VFALGRVQEILLMLDDYWDRNSDLHGIPIYYNSPMAQKCLRIFETYTNMCSDSVQEQANRCSNPWQFKYIQNMTDRHQLITKEADLGPCVVLAAPGMLQSGASRELFEAWAPDKKNGIIMSGYSVAGTLAHELKNDPEQVTLSDGRRVAVRATIKFISFSAHSDYNQSSEFIRRLKANVVVLVHGEEHEMNRMRARLREDYPEVNACSPQNCQTVALRVPADRSAEAVGQVAEQLARGSTKRGRNDISGLLIEDPTGSRLLISPEDLSSYTTLSACKVEQCQRFAFQHSLAVLCRALWETYDDVEIVDGCLSVCGCVRVSLSKQVLCINWEASPVADLIADSVALAAIELTRSPSAVQALQSQEDAGSREDRLFKVLCTYLQQEFGHVNLDEPAQIARLRVDGLDVTVDFPSRSVTCGNEALRERLRLCLRRCETALRPLAPF